MHLDDLLALRHFAAIAHHIPGRLRLKFDPAVRDHPRFEALREAERLFPGVVNARVNTMARSMIVEYDPAVAEPELVQNLFAGDDATAAASAARLAEAYGHGG